jgi:hypothetical protein
MWIKSILKAAFTLQRPIPSCSKFPCNMHKSSQKLKTLCAILLCVLYVAPLHAAKSSALKAGAFRIDLNGKVRDLCVNEISLPELSSKGWRDRLAEQGVHCELSNVRKEKALSSWTGKCSSPGMGKVFYTRHDVSLKVVDNNSFEILTLMSGDLQARIPVRATRLTENKGQCDSQHDTFRPWQ